MAGSEREAWEGLEVEPVVDDELGKYYRVKFVSIGFTTEDYLRIVDGMNILRTDINPRLNTTELWLQEGIKNPNWPPAEKAPSKKEPEPEVQEDSDMPPGSYTREDLEAMTKVDLLAECQKHGLKVRKNARKGVFVAKLLELNPAPLSKTLE